MKCSLCMEFAFCGYVCCYLSKFCVVIELVCPCFSMHFFLIEMFLACGSEVDFRFLVEVDLRFLV